MKYLKTSLVTLFVLLVLLYLHVLGMDNHLYVTYWFYDVILHFLGGFSIALAGYCIAQLGDITYIKNNWRYLIYLTFIGGMAWEVFEVYFDIAGHAFGTTLYNIDTVKDLIMDTLGGLLLYFIIRKIK